MSELQIILESFESIQSNVQAVAKDSHATERKLQLYRMQRLNEKVATLTHRQIEQQNFQQATEYIALGETIHRAMAQLYVDFAEQADANGNFEAASAYWLNALSIQSNAVYLVQYADFVLKNTGLLMHRPLQENMKLIEAYNIKEITSSFKLIRQCVQHAVKLAGESEHTSELLLFLNALEQEIQKRADLKLALAEKEEVVTLDMALNELNQLIGMATVKEKVHEISNWILYAQLRQQQGFKTDSISYHMVFSGNPGTGKTTVARIIAKIFKAMGILTKGHLVEVGRADLVAEFVGQTAIKTTQKLKQAENGVLFVDEAYALSRSEGHDYGIEAIDTIVKAMEDQRDSLVIILAGYPTEMEQFLQTNPGLYSRFKYHIHFPDYSSDELLEILDAMLVDKQYRMDERATKIAEQLIQHTMLRKPNEHGNGRLVRNVLEDAILKKAVETMQKNRSQEPVEIDLIDGEIMQLVEQERAQKTT